MYVPLLTSLQVHIQTYTYTYAHINTRKYKHTRARTHAYTPIRARITFATGARKQRNVGIDKHTNIGHGLKHEYEYNTYVNKQRCRSSPRRFRVDRHTTTDYIIYNTSAYT